MVFDQIEKLKQDYTDKYVVVDGERPELARFRGATGRIKTVNMSGRALVEFEANNNIGWYDIDLDYLKVVDQPLPKPAESKEKPAKTEPAPKPKAAAPAGEKKLSPLEMARSQGAAKKPGAAPKKSTADILAAARGGKAAAPAKAEATAAPAAAPAEKPAAKSGKPSTAEILAAARANKGAAPAAPAAAASEQAAPTAVEEAPQAAAPEPEAEPEVEAAPVKAAPAKSSGAALSSTADKIAWCREHDAK
jgi:hypothetical protein